ncbi:DNA replication protein DnaC [Streptomyces sp. V4I2]|nr:DNA replication protein DnaC [Streptomyces sp. V4I2]
MAAAILEKEHVPAPDEWKQTFTDPRLCAAIVDRVTFNAHIVETGTDSFRFKKTQEKHRKS